MKKKVLLLTILMMLIAGVVTASSINGEYKGYSIVNVNVNGKFVSSDIPAINFDGVTLIPLRAAGEALGNDVSWDPNSFTASLTSKRDKEMKFLNRVSDCYVSVILISHKLDQIKQNIMTAYNAIHDNTEPDKYGQIALNSIDEFSKSFDYTKNAVKPVINDSYLYGLNVSDINTKLDTENYSLSLFKDALDILVRYQANKSTDLNPFFDKMGKGITDATTAGNDAMSEYFKMFSKIQNY